MGRRAPRTVVCPSCHRLHDEFAKDAICDCRCGNSFAMGAGERRQVFYRTRLGQCYMSKVGTYIGNGFETFHERDLAPDGTPCVCSIGDWCSIGTNVKVHLGGYHHADWVTTSPIAEDLKSTYGKGNVEICSDVWIGNCAVIMSGVRLGYGSIVAAHSVVTKSVDDYAIVGGNPAKLIRYRFPQEQREKLLAIQWWHWPEMTVRERWKDFCQPDIDWFIAKYSSADSNGVLPQ